MASGGKAAILSVIFSMMSAVSAAETATRWRTEEREWKAKKEEGVKDGGGEEQDFLPPMEPPEKAP